MTNAQNYELIWYRNDHEIERLSQCGMFLLSLECGVLLLYRRLSFNSSRVLLLIRFVRLYSIIFRIKQNLPDNSRCIPWIVDPFQCNLSERKEPIFEYQQTIKCTLCANASPLLFSVSQIPKKYGFSSVWMRFRCELSEVRLYIRSRAFGWPSVHVFISCNTRILSPPPF